ncbi:MAG TPA: methylmalonyl Co-A mutase-associated GTPase MeaB [Jatrophihabitans sp.]|nr:methylmalonyl Co-A mutase-associated GTPase MeaB [Jatrophihabitans sp.]
MSSRRPADLTDLVDRTVAGDARSTGRLLSLVEDASPALPELLRLLAPHTGRAQVVGITGAPGVGKSTTTSALIGALRAEGRRVGVLAVDPSSPFTGGALLGDRIRMGEHGTDPGVFVRSMASRGHLGGLAAAAPQALRVLDAAGYDVVLIETVGVGQSEVDVMGLADTTVVLLAPGLGDSIQAAKAGILEIADVFVVNKADRADAGELSRQLRHLQAMAPGQDWTPPIVPTVATEQRGIDRLLAALAEHRAFLDSSGQVARRRRDRARHEIEAIAADLLRRRLAADDRLPGLSGQVAAGEIDPYAAAEQLLAR